MKIFAIAALIMAFFALFIVLWGFHTQRAPQNSILVDKSDEVPTSTPTPNLNSTEMSTVHQLAGSTLLASQRDTFGRIVIEGLDLAFGVKARGTVAVIELIGIPYVLLACNGELDSDNGPVPNQMAVTVEFGAYEIANLAPELFAQVTRADAMELHFITNPPDKYGNPRSYEFFKAIVTREQASKMNWTWFRSAVLYGTFDPSAFDEFAFFGGIPPIRQNISDVLFAIRQSSDNASAAFGLPDPKGKALALATQMANWTNCAIPFRSFLGRSQ